MENNLNKQPKKYEVGLIIVSLVLVFGFVIYTAIQPKSSLAAVNGLFDWLIKYTGGILECFTFFVVVISIYFCCGSKYGNVKLGEGKPEYSTFSYISMMFLAACASALLYWSFTEWAFYFEAPGNGMEAGSTEALESSLAYSFFHWGIHGQAVYVVIALAIAYAFYIRKVPSLQTSAVVQSMLGEKVKPGAKSIIGKVVDFCVIFGVVGGLGVTLGLAVPLTGGALTTLFGIEITFPWQVAIVIGIGCVFTFTSFVGTNKGMKRISNFAVACALLLCCFIFLVGPTDYILKNTVNSFGWMLEIIPRAQFFTDPITNGGFPEGWTLFFQAFYLNYAAMMGIFIAKISKGRTIRELAIATLFGISAGGWVIFAVDTSYAQWTHLQGITDVVELVNSGVGEAGIYQILGTLPLGTTVLPIIVLLTIVGFVASSLDSASLALSQTTQKIPNAKGDVNPMLRIFWCVILVLIPLVMMFIGAPFGILKTLCIIISMPFMVIVAYMTIRVIQWLGEDYRSGFLDKFKVNPKTKTAPIDEEQ